MNKLTVTILTLLIISTIVLSYFLFKMNSDKKYTLESAKINNSIILYIGTYGPNLYRIKFNPTTYTYDTLKSINTFNSSYITVQNSTSEASVPFSVIYALEENGENSGISAWQNNKTPTFINRIDMSGDDPCYLTYYKNYIFTANYSGGSISVFPVSKVSGEILPASQTIKFKGEGPNKLRQKSSHLHTVRVLEYLSTPYLIATDLGCDKIYTFKITENSSSLELTDLKEFAVSPGYGPRHIDFSDNYMYLLNELSGKILVYELTEKDNNLSLNLVQEVASDSSGNAACADIHVSPNKQFLYSSNRRTKDGIMVFSLKDNKIDKNIGFVPTNPHPRNFIITNDNSLMFVASKDKNSIQIFKIKKDGMLEEIIEEINLNEDQPVCIQIENNNVLDDYTSF